jgi:Flp pilus assembly protein TadD
LQKSQAQVRAGNLSGALREASDARHVEPFASEPRLQEGLVLEAQGLLPAALGAAREATRLEPKEWRVWAVRSRIEAESGNPKAAVASFKMARSLNSRSVLFSR